MHDGVNKWRLDALVKQNGVERTVPELVNSFIISGVIFTHD
jgi:hypothetical protein